MRRSILLTVLATFATLGAACTGYQDNRPAAPSPAVSPTVTTTPVSSPGPLSTASPSTSPTVDDKKGAVRSDDKKGETKASPNASPTVKTAATPEKK